MKRTVKVDAATVRRWSYPAALTLVLLSWAIYMTSSNSWALFPEYWSASVTMTLGSFVAGATAEGGAAIAFPVFTKVLAIEPETARTFGLMIQSIGMVMASLIIVVRRVPILHKVILWVSLGGVFGQLLGTFWISVGSPNSKILFTFVATVFGIALIVSRWMLKLPVLDTLPTWRVNDRIYYVLIGVAGGTFAANTGSGIDMLTFIVLTLAIGINEKVSTPTTVVIMAINSVVGFVLHAAVVGDIASAMPYWLVSIPVVVFGAPLGALVASKAARDHIIVLLVSLIGIELATTLILVPFSPAARALTLSSIVVSLVWFSAMLGYRVSHVVPAVYARQEQLREQQEEVEVG